MTKISIILNTARGDYSVPSWGNIHLFEPTLESLRKQIFKDFELIVVDVLYEKRKNFFIDHPQPFPVLHIPPKDNPFIQRGLIFISTCKNTGVLYARGELIVFLDDACTFLESLLERYWYWYTMGYCSWALYKYVENFKLEPSFLQNGEIRRDDREALLFQNGGIWYNQHPTYGFCGIPLKTVLKLNGYDEMYDGSKCLEDGDFGRRIQEGGNRTVMDEGLFIYEYPHGDIFTEIFHTKESKCNGITFFEMKHQIQANTERKDIQELNKFRPCMYHENNLCRLFNRVCDKPDWKMTEDFINMWNEWKPFNLEEDRINILSSSNPWRDI